MKKIIKAIVAAIFDPAARLPHDGIIIEMDMFR